MLEVLKRSCNRKYKHKKLFKNPDGSEIKSKTEFVDSQINHCKSKNTVIIRGIYLSKDHLPFDAIFYYNKKTNILITAKNLNSYSQYVGPREMAEDELNNLIKHGIVGKDSSRFKDISWVKPGMKAEQILRISNLRENGKITDEAMDSVEASKAFSELFSYPDSDSTQEL